MMVQDGEFNEFKDNWPGLNLLHMVNDRLVKYLHIVEVHMLRVCGPAK